MNQLEIACFNVESAVIAQENGADRVELCASIEVGGTTPDFEITKKIKELINIDLNVMIRPRGGNFVYSDAEFNQMKLEVIEFKKLNVNGFVFGILNEDNSINIIQNTELVNLAKPFTCTFHRAFDEVSHVFQSLEEIIECGFQTILTSGQMPNVVEGANRLAELVSKANKRITIMPGGGLRASNLNSIQEKTRAAFYHSSAITNGSETANPDEITALKSILK
ncbi:copper homeostasis protein CutC [Flavobacterium aquatile]|uniref:PF03932 family protein CutC n=1 Tax=Flavobacterium aquatile LMG 4008 = ATCC 11947 TaxID=1453498 RepID=A0A095U431_9FLAO|nr:copper homeostasis protein CutC [Flavobacterium aquatile]KGD69403.1 copper homeostasis protein [Flavobacterium aquatile LMG 4008 = ATCC 11947]OXA66142.1 copper homeostasis protein CutC [Flavobacterium aquatile LMG 4008 = ATCC 11947]GEC77629.1 copper homeostasis protein CutC [Flavobacterium aquatile]